MIVPYCSTSYQAPRARRAASGWRAPKLEPTPGTAEDGTYVCVYVYIYIHIERERKIERDREIDR